MIAAAKIVQIFRYLKAFLLLPLFPVIPLNLILQMIQGHILPRCETDTDRVAGRSWHPIITNCQDRSGHLRGQESTPDWKR
jgi:hypothetical protein